MVSGTEYIKYRLKAKYRHGVHSPFIFDLTDTCLRRKIPKSVRTGLNDLFKRYRNDRRTISFVDHGAGSKSLDRTRKVSDIARISSSRGRYGRLLYKLVNHYKPERILEFGTSIGVGTYTMKLAHPTSKIVTIEADPATHSLALETFDSCQIEVNAVNTTFDAYLAQLPDNEKFDFIFIDGHHDGKALLSYLERLDPHIHNDTLILLDDIRWSKGMFEAWKTICTQEKFHVTVDFFRMGLICQRKQQHKEHFIIRH